MLRNELIFIRRRVIYRLPKRKTKTHAEEKNMKRTTYTFKKDGKTYSTTANNRLEARDNIEIRFGISLSGATYEEVYKLRVVRTGKEK